MDYISSKVYQEINNKNYPYFLGDEEDNYFQTLALIDEEGIDFSREVSEYINKVSITIEDIILPKGFRSLSGDGGYYKLIKNISGIYFYKCIFYENLSNKSNIEKFERCIFEDIFHKQGFSESGCVYNSCIFKKSILFKGVEEDNRNVYDFFEDCVFLGGMHFDNLIIHKEINIINKPDIIQNDFLTRHVVNSEDFYFFKRIYILDCEFEGDLKINGWDNKVTINNIDSSDYELKKSPIRIEELVIRDTKFRKKLELKINNIEYFEFSNSNVDGIFDVYKSSFEKSKFYRSIFKDFAGFEKVGFGKKGCFSQEYQTKFIYTTFVSFSNFRRTVFHSGLDFERVNLKEQPNFLGVIVDGHNTNRETYRIIKDSFDSNGNHIEANKFFAEEMRAYKNELFSTHNSKEGKWAEKLIFLINWLISDFGKSYIRPFMILLLLIILYFGSYAFYESWYASDIYSVPKSISHIYNFLNNCAKNFMPFSRFIENKKGFEFVSLICYILFAVLIWQIVVAVKRHTQR